MEKTVKLFSTAMTLWLLAASCAHSAGLYEKPAKYNRGGQVVAKESQSQRNARADAELGFRYEHGLGVPQSFEVASALYIRAAEQGDPTGQYLLGLMYDKGHGVWQDGVLAYKWVNLAAANAPPRNREYYLRLRKALATKLTPSQLAIGQWLAVEWVPKPPSWWNGAP